MAKTKILDWKHDVGPGWHPILEDLHKKLSVLAPEYDALQVKEKFGGLRVYLGGVPVEEDVFTKAYALVNEAEAQSYKTCEVCGASGVTRRPKGSAYGWIRTVCDEHWE